VIAISNRGFNSSFTVRRFHTARVSSESFQTHSPAISDISIKRPRQCPAAPSCITCAICRARRPPPRRKDLKSDLFFGRRRSDEYRAVYSPGAVRGLDVLRRFLHLIFLLVVFGFVFGTLRVSLPTVPAKAALLVAPEGELVEQMSGDPFERAIQGARGQGRPETLLWDVTDSIRAAAKDKRIPVLAIDLERFDRAGQPTLEELARAIREFRATGKKVIAFGHRAHSGPLLHRRAGR